MRCMVRWKVQEGEEGQTDIADCTVMGITAGVREAEDRQTWGRIVKWQTKATGMTTIYLLD